MPNSYLTSAEETTIDGIYRLGAVVRRSIKGTVYETEHIDEYRERRPAVIRIVEGSRDDLRATLKRWQDAKELSHPNLARLFAAGIAGMNGVPVAYVVMERADESLSTVLAERPLAVDEMREMLGPAVEALRYLHKKGYAHGDLKPSSVLAIGDQLKLSTDSVIRAADGGAAEDDIRALGELIHEAQHSSAGPFENIARHCLESDPARRWTADEIAAQLKAPDVVLDVEGSSAAPATGESSPSQPLPMWIFAGLAVTVLAILLWSVLRKNDSAAAPIAPAPAVTHALPPATPRPAPFVTPRATGRRESGWSVIVAAYKSREAAEKRMRSLAARWPRFHVSVSEPVPGSMHYLVVLGEKLREDEAVSLRDRAVAAGLPRDTYIKRLTQE